jgi:hypothetical protein
LLLASLSEITRLRSYICIRILPGWLMKLYIILPALSHSGGLDQHEFVPGIPACEIK